MIITVLDAIGIQDYIFGSNKLKDNIGASGLVYMALNCWPIETLQKEFPGRVNPSCGYQPDVSCSIIKNNGQFDAELFYAGGGNTVLFFKNRDCARKFALAYSIRLLADAPGLRVECIHHEMEKDFDSLAKIGIKRFDIIIEELIRSWITLSLILMKRYVFMQYKVN